MPDELKGTGAGAGATRSVLPLLLLLFLTGCLSYQEVTFKGITDVEVGKMDRSGVSARVTVTLDAKAKAWVAEKGYDPVFGARPLKRFLQRHLETQLARALIAGEVTDDTKVAFKVKDGALVLAT